MDKLKIVTMFFGYEPKNRFCVQRDTISRTIQDAVVDVPSLLKQFNGRLDDLFDRFNNGLVFESTIGVFVDELNEKELKQYNDMVAKQKAAELEKQRNDELFAAWKAEKAKEVEAARAAAGSAAAGSAAAQTSASQ